MSRASKDKSERPDIDKFPLFKKSVNVYPFSLKMAIHPTAIIDPSAQIGADVVIGPYSVIGAQVTLGARCVLANHVTLAGPTRIGKENIFYPFCSIGQRTQDLKYCGEPTYLDIGSSNIFREFCTVNRGTAIGKRTVIGDHNNFLTYCHIAHDCIVGSHTIFSNNGTIAGHVTVEDYAIIGGFAAVHQFCRIGAHSILGACSKVTQDVLPFMIADGNPAALRGVNKVGLERREFPDDVIRMLHNAYRLLCRSKLNVSQAVAAIREELPVSLERGQLLNFIKASQRGLVR